jgi:hypothetical protein
LVLAEQEVHLEACPGQEARIRHLELLLHLLVVAAEQAHKLALLLLVAVQVAADLIQ